MSQRRHVVHLVYRFAAGGLENVIVQLINGLPADRFRHTVVALTSVDPDFQRRVKHSDVRFVALDKPPGQPFAMYPRMWRLLRQLKPDVFHSCNLAALEFAPVAAAAGVPRRVHAEHGWDVADPDGSNRKYQVLRRVYQRFVQQFVVVSEQLQRYLLERVGIEASRVELIANGVDTQTFCPDVSDPMPPDWPFDPVGPWVIGTVGRLEPIKNQMLLGQAFVEALRQHPAATAHWRLALIGAGPGRDGLEAFFRQAGVQDRVWLPGARSDIATLLRQLDCFVLPSLAEGTSCTLQEAMASALPIIATDVGGNARLLDHGRLGVLVPSAQVEAMAAALWAVAQDVPAARQRASLARQEAESRHSLNAMLSRYEGLFNQQG